MMDIGIALKPNLGVSLLLRSIEDEGALLLRRAASRFLAPSGEIEMGGIKNQ